MALTVPLFSCTAAHDERQWFKGAARDSFAPWVGAKQVKLPSSKTAFEAYIKILNADQYLAGNIAGAKLSIAPPTFFEPKCSGSAAIVFQFPYDEKLQAKPTFVAYLDSKALVRCVENHTLTPSM